MGHTQRVNSADDALSYFAACRTDTRLRGHSQGVETPSQVRYVKQLWQHLQQTGSWCPKSVPECKAPTLCLQALEFVFETPPMEASSLSIKLGGATVSGDIRIIVL